MVQVTVIPIATVSYERGKKQICSSPNKLDSGICSIAKENQTGIYCTGLARFLIYIACLRFLKKSLNNRTDMEKLAFKLWRKRSS